MTNYKLISSKIELTVFENQENGTIWDFVKTQNNTNCIPNSDGTVTFNSKGLTQIRDNFYEYNFQRTFKVSLNLQNEYDDFIYKVLVPWDDLIFKGHGEDSQAESLD